MMINKDDIVLILAMIDNSDPQLEAYVILKEKLEIMRDQLISQEVAHKKALEIHERIKKLDEKLKK